MIAVRVLAPAKVNLGLAVLGKRVDGYHEIDTIMAMLDLADVITVRETDRPGISIAGMDDVPVESNLITKAIRGWCDRAGRPAIYRVDVEKHIPSPAGLGGGSSDAAATIRALDMIHPDELSATDRHDLAASLGADCPFFLGTAAARATGTGKYLQPVPAPAGWVVLVVPPTGLAAKTATLYASLLSDDYGSQEDIDAIAHSLRHGETSQLRNSFSRAAHAALPAVKIAMDALTDVAGECALSGAGPAVYALVPDESLTDTWLAELRAMLPSHFFVAKSRFLKEPPVPERVS